MNGTQYGGLILDVLAGIGALLVGLGVFLGGLALAKTLSRLRETLDGVDRQLESVGTPARGALGHVEGVTKSLEHTAGTISRTVDLTRSAIVPSIVDVGATLSGVTAGLRRLVTGKNRTFRE
ncbi:MAG: hypothetical protein JO030_04015 [Candidatus Eremiobacteraeota bacterium]|nr:hypothetical protein [Candidatus Eremiobacteraeota bacterium]